MAARAVVTVLNRWEPLLSAETAAERKLVLAIINQAILDLSCSNGISADARAYFVSGSFRRPAVLAGLDPDWILRLLFEARLLRRPLVLKYENFQPHFQGKGHIAIW